MNFMGITRKDVVLSHLCAILTSDYEERRERHDRYGRGIAYTGRGRQYAQDQTAYSPEVHRQWDIGSRQGWRSLEGKTGGDRGLPCKEYQSKRRPEINKATPWWQTIENLAVRLPLEPGKLRRDNPGCTLHICSIASLTKKCQRLCKSRVHERMVYP